MKITDRRRGMNSYVLPYDAEIEFLQSSGTQYILIAPNFVSLTDDITLEFQLLNGSGLHIFGFDSSNGGGRCCVQFYENYIQSRCATQALQISTRAYTAYDFTSRFRCYLSRNKRQVWKNDTLMSENTSDGGSFTTMNGTVLAVFESAPLYNSKAKMKLYSLLWKRNDIPLYDMIPVRVGTTGYLFDRVSGELFANAGSGDFILGPDIVGGGHKLLIINLMPFSVERRVA